MKMERFLVIVLLVTVAFTATTQADWIGRLHWNGSVDQNYGEALNWSLEAAQAPFTDGMNFVPNNIPGDPSYEADMFLDIAGPGPVLNQDATINVVHMGGADWPGNVVKPAADVNFGIQSGNMNVLYWFVIGEQFGSSGTIDMSGGSLTVGADLMFGAHQGGSGTLNMTGGVITTNNLFTAFAVDGANVSQQSGLINLDGGVINVNGGLITNDRGLIDITEGQLNIAGSWAQEILDNQVAWGQITAYGGVGDVLTNYNAGTNMTEITAVIPEPATMTLLGLGVIGLIRRKK